jgi:iron(III) transport system substrate-binding protein
MSLITSVRRAALLSAVLLGLVFSSGALAQTRRLSVVCSVQIEWCELVQSEYQKVSGVKLTMIHRSSIDALAMLLMERNNPRTDLWFGGTGDPHLQAAEQKMTIVYKSPLFDDLQPWAQAQAERAGYRSVGVYSGILVLAYRPDEIRRIRAEPPKCWRDLVAPEYKSQVMMGNPGSSGTGFLIIAALTQLFGEDQAIAYLKRLHRNIAQYTHGGRGSMENVVRGEASVAIAFMHDVIAARERGANLEFSLPCEGTVSEIGSMSLIAGGPNPAEAKLFYDWALGPEAQTLARKGNAFQYPSNRKVVPESRVIDPGLSVLIAYDHRRFGSGEIRKRLLARWINEVNVPGNE